MFTGVSVWHGCFKISHFHWLKSGTITRKSSNWLLIQASRLRSKIKNFPTISPLIHKKQNSPRSGCCWAVSRTADHYSRCWSTKAMSLAIASCSSRNSSLSWRICSWFGGLCTKSSTNSSKGDFLKGRVKAASSRKRLVRSSLERCNRFLLDGGKLGARWDELGRECFYAGKAFCSECLSYLEYVPVAQAILPFL